MSKVTCVRQLFVIIVGMMLTFTQESKAWSSPVDSIKITFRFRLSSDLLLQDYYSNAAAISQLNELLDSYENSQIKNIYITGGASPEGNLDYNLKLSHKRALAVYKYILWKSPRLNKESIHISSDIDLLNMWQKAVVNAPRLPRRDKVLDILQTDKSLPTKWANIRLLSGGPAGYLSQHIFPELRNAVSCIVVLQLQEEEHPEKQHGKEMPLSENSNWNNAENPAIISAITAAVGDSLNSDSLYIKNRNITHPLPETFIYTPLLAVKTNLLFDAATMLNVEVEFPIGKRWSVAAEWIFPWWLWEKKQHCLELLNGNVEGRYWLGKRDNREVLTGWFGGIYTGGGYYDLEWEKKGYQGEFFIASGVSAGFAHRIGKNLRLEYSLGIGYMQTRYRKYEAMLEADDEWHLYKRGMGKYAWFGPTRAKVSLVWLLYSRKRGGAL